MSRVLITGGCGFLGAAAAARARAARHSVTTADILPGADRALDAGDPEAIAALVADTRPDAIVHLAAGLTDAGERDPVGTVRLNALGTAAVFAAAEKNGGSRHLRVLDFGGGANHRACRGRYAPRAGQRVRRDQGVLRALRAR
jgi:nucleoside-diphosphate-sugar epimerase